MPETLAALETAAYLEALKKRYESIADVQKAFIKEVQATYENECFCKQ